MIHYIHKSVTNFVCLSFSAEKVTYIGFLGYVSLKTAAEWIETLKVATCKTKTLGFQMLKPSEELNCSQTSGVFSCNFFLFIIKKIRPEMLKSLKMILKCNRVAVKIHKPHSSNYLLYFQGHGWISLVWWTWEIQITLSFNPPGGPLRPTDPVTAALEADEFSHRGASLSAQVLHR